MLDINVEINVLEKILNELKTRRMEKKEKETLSDELMVQSKLFIMRLDMMYKKKGNILTLKKKGELLKGSGEDVMNITKSEIEYLNSIETSITDIYSSGRTLLERKTLAVTNELLLKMREYRDSYYSKGRISTARLYKLRCYSERIINSMVG